MNCSIFETYGSISKLTSYGIDIEPCLKKTERQKALQLLQDLYTCVDADPLVCGESLGTLNCVNPVITAKPNNLTIVGLTNGVLTRVDWAHLKYTATITLSFLNPLITSYFTAFLDTHEFIQTPLSILANGAFQISAGVTNWSRIGTSNSWNIEIVFTETSNVNLLPTDTYRVTGTINVTDTITLRAVNFDSGNTIV